MKYCKKCLQPDTRPRIVFDEQQVCGACVYEESKKNIDWEARKKELQEIADWAKNEAKRKSVPYDCVIGVSGGKDSTYQAFYAREKLGLHPLLVNCRPDKLTEIGRKNLETLANHGFDIIQIYPDSVIARKLAKKGFYEYGNIQRASEFCLWTSAFRIAVQWSIPLVIQGENSALTLGEADGLNMDDNAFGVFNSNTLSGGDVSIWVQDDISLGKLYFYQRPSVEEMEKNNIRSIFLQYYDKNWSQVGNADFSIARGLLGRAFEDLHDIGRYRRYTCLDEDEIIANQMIKYYKFGFGFATDEACYDIREGRLSREDAIWLVKEYDGKCGRKYIDAVCEYLEINETEFWRVVDTYVNRKLFWKDEKTGKWIPKFEIGKDFDED